MRLDKDFNHLASTVTKVLIRKLALRAFFWSTVWHRDVSGPKASEITFLRQLLAYDILKKS
jgi:hypothetical protein